jgi:hypothetical protein
MSTCVGICSRVTETIYTSIIIFCTDVIAPHCHTSIAYASAHCLLLLLLLLLLQDEFYGKCMPYLAGCVPGWLVVLGLHCPSPVWLEHCHYADGPIRIAA